jgi:hypothetical protein
MHLINDRVFIPKPIGKLRQDSSPWNRGMGRTIFWWKGMTLSAGWMR